MAHAQPLLVAYLVQVTAPGANARHGIQTTSWGASEQLGLVQRAEPDSRWSWESGRDELGRARMAHRSSNGTVVMVTTVNINEMVEHPFDLNGRG